MAAGVLLILYFQMGPKPELYAKAEAAMAKWRKIPNGQTYEEMRSFLKKTPALEKKYRPLIAQKLLEGGRISEGVTLAYQALQEARREAPLYAAYAETSLWVEQKSYQKALQQAVALREEMRRLPDWEVRANEGLKSGRILYVHNLIRIAFLQKELQNQPGEKAAWEELEAFLKPREELSAVAYEPFRDKEICLAHYIAERKKDL